MTTIEKIKREIQERLSLQSCFKGEFAAGSRDALQGLLSFLSTIESEKPNDKVVEGEVILNGHGLLVDVTKWGDGYKLKVIIKEN